MKRKTLKWGLLFGVIVILILSGCNGKYQYDIRVTTTIKEYTPFSSATPGLPLGISIIDKNGDRVSETFNYSFKTQYGSFVTWKLIDHRLGNYKVTTHGNEYNVDNAYQVAMFWGTLRDNNYDIPEEIKEIIIDITVTDDSGEIVAIKQATIERKEKYRYSLVKE